MSLRIPPRDEAIWRAYRGALRALRHDKINPPPKITEMIRAFQWDLARQVERLDWLLAQLPRYAAWGYQELYLHLEDAVEYPSLPGVARRDAYSYRQLARLVDAATRAGIKVVPIVNLLGHTQYLIKVPELRDLNELRAPDGSPLERGQICPLHPRTLEVAEKLLRDMAPFCTAGKVHVGLDESFHLGQHPQSRAEVAAIGLPAHFARYVGRLHALTEARGLRLGLWADMLALLPATIPLLPRGVIAYDWYYYPFAKKPKIELRNFTDYDLAPALRARGIEYWGCPMNGAFRYEPLPVFGERLDNIRAWWQRCHAVGAAGMLVTSWEAYRLAIETTTVVDAAAASLWLELDGAKKSNTVLLARGLEKVGRVIPNPPRLDPTASNRRVKDNAPYLDTAKALLAADAHAFSGYARWESNDRWDGTSDADALSIFEREEKKFAQLTAQDLPPPLAASVAWRRYLAQRDVFVRRAATQVFAWRRAAAKNQPARFEGDPTAEITAFVAALAAGRTAARAMWKRTRNPKPRGQNETILAADERRLRAWRSWLGAVGKNPAHVWTASPVCGAWQLTFMVHNFAPALQKIVVQQQRTDGTWQDLGGRFTIEFRAAAARRRAAVTRPFSVPVATADAALRLAVRGLGQVAISGVIFTDGVRVLRAKGWRVGQKKILGRPAPRRGFPELNWTQNNDAVALSFPFSPAFR